jgi:hypothetical protein
LNKIGGFLAQNSIKLYLRMTPHLIQTKSNKLATDELPSEKIFLRFLGDSSLELVFGIPIIWGCFTFPVSTGVFPLKRRLS